MGDEQTVIVAKADGRLSLTLNRAEKLNSFNDEMHRELRAALEAARTDAGIRVVTLTGAGRAFCAGQDLGARDPDQMTEPPDLGETLETFYNPLVRLIRGLEKPVICAVNGVAAGAGANLALACDIVLAAKSARFIQAFSKIGLIPDSGGTWMLPNLIGEARAKAVALTGQPVDADTAAAWGMIWQSVPDDALSAETDKLAAGFAAGPTIGFALTKTAIQAAATQSLDAQLDLERDFQREAGRTPDYAEGVAAFLAKRPPRFTGSR